MAKILIDASKLAEPGMDGIKRYVVELLHGLRTVTVSGDFSIDVLIRRKMYRLEDLPEDLTTFSDSEARGEISGTGRDRILRGLGIWLPPVVVPLIIWIIPDSLSRIALGKPKAELRSPEILVDRGVWWAHLLPPAVLSMVYRSLRPFRRVRRWRQSRKALYSRTTIKRKGEHDVVHLTLPNNFHTLPQSLGTPNLVTVHDLSHRVCPQFQNRHNNLTLSMGLERSIAVDARFITVSESTRRDLIAIGGVDPGRATTVLSGCNSRLFYPVKDEQEHHRVRTKYGIPPGPYFLTLCTIEPRKNLAMTIQAFAALVDSLPDANVTLVLAGSRGWKVRKTIRIGRKYAHRVHFTGFVDDGDLAPLYSSASAFIFASHYEGFGFPLLEAMLCELPVIYGDNSSMKEIVGDAGLAVHSDDVEGLAENMRTLLEDRTLATDLGREGRHRAAQFTWTRTAAQTASMYRKILNSVQDGFG